MSRTGNVSHGSVSQDKTKGMMDKLQELKEQDEKQKEEPKATPVQAEVRDLLLFGKVIEEIKVAGYTFKISTLSNRQQRNLLKRLLKLNNEDRMADIKPFTLAESIISVNDMPLESLYSGDEKLDIIEKKIEVVSDLQANVVERLFKKYEEMTQDSYKVFKEGDLAEEIKK